MATISLLIALVFGGMAAPADVSLSLSLGGESQDELRPLDVIIRNDGPGTATGVGVGTFYFATVGSRTVSVVPLSVTPPCRIDYLDFVPPPPAPAGISATIFPPDENRTLPPGQTTTCTVGVLVAPEAPTEVQQSFTVAAFEDDPDPANNTSEIVIVSGSVSAPVAVPVLQPIGLAMLIAFVAMTACRVGRCRAERPHV